MAGRDPRQSAAALGRVILDPVTDTSHLFPGKKFISTVLDALETKTAMSGSLTRVYLMRSAMAGGIIGIMYLAYFACVSAFTDVANGHLVGVGKLVGAAVFGFALIFIYYSKSELLTSNMMVVSIGAYYHRIRAWHGARLLALCFVGNALGGAVVALLAAGSSLADGPLGAAMQDTVAHKLDYIAQGTGGMVDLAIRAILCNFMINLAMLLVYNGLIKEDITMVVVMVVAVFVFAFVGFEHSVADTVLFTMVGVHHGIDVGAAALNIAIVLAGNFVGGGLLIGWYYAYANDDRKHLTRR